MKKTNVLKKSLAGILAVIMLFGAAPLASLADIDFPGITSSAAEYNVDGSYTYEIINGTAEIKGCDDTLSGNIVIPDTLGGYPVAIIGVKAFTGNQKITGVKIPDTVTEIDFNAFSSCSNLYDIKIGKNVKSIAAEAFSNTAYSKNNENWENKVLYIDNCLVDASVGSFVSFGESYTVKEGTRVIAESVFAYCKDIKTIIIPDGVTAIGANAFSHCPCLENVTIPDSVTFIGNAVFFGSPKLAKITLPSNLEYLGGNVFEETQLYLDESNWENGVLYLNNYLVGAKSDISGSLEIKNGTAIIAGYAFEDCKALTEINIPVSVKTIGDSAFSLSGITSIDIPDSVIYLGNKAFSECPALKKAVIGNGVKGIGIRTFDFCEKLDSVTIGNNVEYINDYAFNCCPNITSLTLPESLKFIGKSAFNRIGTKNIVIPDGVVEIFDGAFSNSVLENLTIGTGLKKIGADALGFKLKTINVDKNSPNFSSENDVLFNKEKTQLILYATENAKKDYTVPDTVIEIAPRSFIYCKNLENINFGKNVKLIGNEAFRCCEGIKAVTIPDSVEKIDDYAFSQTYSLESVIIGNGVKHIGEYAFSNGGGSSSSITTLVIGESVEYIGESAFNGARFHSLNIPDSVKVIGDWAFERCFFLDKVIIGSGVEYIGDCAFNGTNIYDVYYIGSEEEWNQINRVNLDRELTYATIHFNYIRIKSIELAKTPDKTVYAYKEAINLDGIIINATTKDDDIIKITDTSKMTVKNFDSSKLGTQTVTVIYENMPVEFNVTVKYVWWQQIIRFLLLGFLWY